MRFYYRLIFAYFQLTNGNPGISGNRTVTTGKVNFREKPNRKTGSRPEVDDQWYNLNQIKTFEENGIDTSHLHVAYAAYPGPNGNWWRTRVERATLDGEFYNEWTEVDPADGKIVIPWAVMDGYPYESKAEQAMESLRLDK